jgi:GTPase SAR1 family protein
VVGDAGVGKSMLLRRVASALVQSSEQKREIARVLWPSTHCRLLFRPLESCGV